MLGAMRQFEKAIAAAHPKTVLLVNEDGPPFIGRQSQLRTHGAHLSGFQAIQFLVASEPSVAIRIDVQAGNSALHYHLDLKPVARRCGDNQSLLGVHIHAAGAIKADGAHHTDRHAKIHGLKAVSHPPG
jgi:hypothetical protein